MFISYLGSVQPKQRWPPPPRRVEQQKCGELLGDRAFYTDSNEEVVSWIMLFSRGSMLYDDDDDKEVVD